MTAQPEDRRRICSNVVRFPLRKAVPGEPDPSSAKSLAADSSQMYNELGVTGQQLGAGEEEAMDWQEKYLDKLDRDISEMKAGLRATEERIAQMVNQTLSEVRDRDNQRHQEFINIRDLLIGERRWIIAMAVTTILGVAAMVITVLLGV